MTDARAGGDIALAMSVLAVDPAGLGGVCLRGAMAPVASDAVLHLRRLLPAAAPVRKMPGQIGDARLFGGLDLAATLQAGRPVFERGLLAEVDGGVLVLPMAERLPLATAKRLCAVLDRGEVAVERDGFTRRNPATFAIIALDDGASADERAPDALLERLAFHADVSTLSGIDRAGGLPDPGRVADARAIVRDVVRDEALVRAFCQAAAAFGIPALRAVSFALRVACAHAALAGRRTLTDEDAAVAARLVLAPRAVVCPAAPPDVPSSEPPPSEEIQSDQDRDATSGKLEDLVLDSVRAALPPHILPHIDPLSGPQRAGAAGRAGEQKQSKLRGRPAGVRRGELSSGVRLNLVETLRAAAPWQPLRRKEAGASATRVRVRRDDFRLNRLKFKSQSATIFVVDASGSSALHRLAEAKGAVEILLSECYVRRDQVALIAFRGKSADLLLPPTRSLARARRLLSALPGGGGTPVALALDAAASLADGLRRKGMAASAVLLTDGRANVARNGEGSRERGEADALAAARACKLARLAAVLVDTSPAGSPAAERLADAMGARYLALPQADATTISRAVMAASPSGVAS